RAALNARYPSAPSVKPILRAAQKRAGYAAHWRESTQRRDSSDLILMASDLANGAPGPGASALRRAAPASSLLGMGQSVIVDATCSSARRWLGADAATTNSGPCRAALRRALRRRFLRAVRAPFMSRRSARGTACPSGVPLGLRTR